MKQFFRKLFIGELEKRRSTSSLFSGRPESSDKIPTTDSKINNFQEPSVVSTMMVGEEGSTSKPNASGDEPVSTNNWSRELYGVADPVGEKPIVSDSDQPQEIYGLGPVPTKDDGGVIANRELYGVAEPVPIYEAEFNDWSRELYGVAEPVPIESTPIGSGDALIRALYSVGDPVPVKSIGVVSQMVGEGGFSEKISHNDWSHNLNQGQKRGLWRMIWDQIPFFK